MTAMAALGSAPEPDLDDTVRRDARQRRSNRDTTSTWEVCGNRSTSWHDDEVVAGLAEEPGVAAEGSRVAADEHDPGGVRWRRPWPTALAPRPGARRVGDDDVGVGGAPVVDVGAHDAGVEPGEVHPGVGRRRRRLLDERHRSVAPRACRRTGRRRRRGRRGGPSGGQRAVDRGRAPRRRAPRRRRPGLEERAGRDPPAVAGQLLVEPGPAPGRQLRRRRRRARRRAPRRGRRRPSTMTRRSPVPAPARSTTSPSGKRPSHDQLVDQRVGDQAGADVDDVVAAPAPEAEPPADGDAAQAWCGSRWPGAPGPRRRRRRGGPGAAARRPRPRP